MESHIDFGVGHGRSLLDHIRKDTKARGELEPFYDVLEEFFCADDCLQVVACGVESDDHIPTTVAKSFECGKQNLILLISGAVWLDAAAEVIGQLRQEISLNVARDNALLEERTRILDTLSTLLDAINHASTEQRGVIDALLVSSKASLAQTSAQFQEQVAAETGKLSDIAAQVTASAVDVASLGETFGYAVRTFSETHEKLMNHLQRIEQAIDKSMTRSDEQLAYYVAQAREMIDLSIGSQKDVLEALQQRQAEGAA